MGHSGSYRIKLFSFLQKYARISRRQAQNEIISRNVEVDDKIVDSPFMWIKPTQKVRLHGKLITHSGTRFRYIVLNKPAGYICSTKGNKTIYDLLGNYGKGLAYVGRLDVQTTGTLIMTNDGYIADKLMRAPVPRVYIVTISFPLDDAQKEILLSGPSLDGRKIHIGKVEISGRQVELEIYEGRHHEVRRIFSSIGARIIKLHRKSFAGISSDNMRPSEWRYLSTQEIANLKKLVKILSS